MKVQPRMLAEVFAMQRATPLLRLGTEDGYAADSDEMRLHI